jgi:hypothetical protein
MEAGMNPSMQRLIALTKRTVGNIIGPDKTPTPRKSMDVERIARAAESKQRFAKGRHFKWSSFPSSEIATPESPEKGSSGPGPLSTSRYPGTTESEVLRGKGGHEINYRGRILPLLSRNGICSRAKRCHASMHVPEISDILQSCWRWAHALFHRKDIGGEVGIMSLQACPSCGGLTTFLGNESETGKSWFKCLTTGHVFPLKLLEIPRFGFEASEWPFPALSRETFLYHASHVCSMEKAYKTMTLRFSPELHAKLVKLKQESAARSWEEWILKITGIEDG